MVAFLVTPAMNTSKTAFLKRICGDKPEALVELGIVLLLQSLGALRTGQFLATEANAGECVFLGVVLTTEDAYALLDNASDTSEEPSHPRLLPPTGTFFPYETFVLLEHAHDAIEANSENLTF